MPEIQQPFVWDAVKVRNLMDSPYQGYPIGNLIVCQIEKVRLKDGRGSLRFSPGRPRRAASAGPPAL
jgi:hypothetical protein